MSTRLLFANAPHHHANYNHKGQPIRVTLHRVGQSSREFIQAHSNKLVRVVTDNEEVFGYLIRHDLGGVRIGHCLGFVRDNYRFSQQQRAAWVIDDVKAIDVKSITELN